MPILQKLDQNEIRSGVQKTGMQQSEKLAVSNCLFQNLAISLILDQIVNEKQIWKLRLLNLMKNTKALNYIDQLTS